MSPQRHPGIALIAAADVPLALAQETLQTFYEQLQAKDFHLPDNPALVPALNDLHRALNTWRTFLVDQCARQLDETGRDPLGLAPWPHTDHIAALKARLDNPEDPLPYLSDAHVHSTLLLQSLVQALLRLRTLDPAPAAEAAILSPTHALAHHIKDWREAMDDYKDHVHAAASQ